MHPIAKLMAILLMTVCEFTDELLCSLFGTIDLLIAVELRPTLEGSTGIYIWLHKEYAKSPEEVIEKP
jgi:hypothetical protein